MPETPDFKALAYRVASMNCESIGLLDEEIRQHPDTLDDTIAILKEVWNARGAADLAKIELFGDDEGYDPAPSVQELNRAIRSLDR